jgi:glycerol-3-phosphate dehydrogenase
LHQACGGHEFFFENNDGRIVLIYPVNDRVIVGTSDLKIDNPDDARCTDEEVDYFLELIGKIFPNLQVDRSQIVFKFSGVRPLPYSDANTTGQISRDHSNRIIEPDETRSFPIFNLIGGKWTTFRAFGEQVADSTLERLGVARKGSTAGLAIGGGKDYPKTSADQEKWITKVAEKAELSRDRLRTLFERYGTRAADIAYFIADGDDTPLTSLPTYSKREIVFLVRTEKVTKLDDLLLRRTPLGMYGHLTMALVQELADITAEVLEWPTDLKQEMIQSALAILANKHDIHFD